MLPILDLHREEKSSLCPLFTEAPSEERKIILWSKDERSCFWKEAVIASNIPVAPWLLSGPRHSKNSNVSFILSGSMKKTDYFLFCNTRVSSLHNIAMKLTLTSPLYISCLKKYSAILLIKSLHPDSFSFYQQGWHLYDFSPSLLVYAHM